MELVTICVYMEDLPRAKTGHRGMALLGCCAGYRGGENGATCWQNRQRMPADNAGHLHQGLLVLHTGSCPLWTQRRNWLVIGGGN